MSQKNRATLYEEFKNGDIPDENDFADTIDSALNLVDDGLTSYKIRGREGEFKRFGIGDTAPDCPLGIKGELGQGDKMICFTSNDEAQHWNINLSPAGIGESSVADRIERPIAPVSQGFSIDDMSSGIGASRFFIENKLGNIGISTVTPNEKLHVSGANDGANISIHVENLESGEGGGWLLSAVDDNTVPERIKTFAIHEKTTAELSERITILATQPKTEIRNVGINEVLPYATLHVSRSAADPLEPVNMRENTGILLLGQIDDSNLAMDSSQVQARVGSYVPGSSTLQFKPGELALQPFGGNLTVNKSVNDKSKVTIDSDGKIGIGKTATEKVEINGAVVVGDTNTAAPSDGTIRWNVAAADLQVWQNGQWNSLTTHTNTDGIWTDAGGGMIYYNPVGTHPKVGIGTETPNAALHVREAETEATTNSGAAIIHNQAATLQADPNMSRVGLGIKCNGVWSSNADALNIGLYISDVSGQTVPESNIAALMNGNVVVGNVTGDSLVGENGTNVLAIQNGAVPTTIPGITETTGIQIYSANVTVGAAGTPFSAFHLMTGDGVIMKLYRQPNMTAPDINAPNTGNAITDALIENMRTRINELENILKALGLLAP